jgi:hypothetical protein
MVAAIRAAEHRPVDADPPKGLRQEPEVNPGRRRVPSAAFLPWCSLPLFRFTP